MLKRAFLSSSSVYVLRSLHLSHRTYPIGPSVRIARTGLPMNRATPMAWTGRVHGGDGTVGHVKRDTGSGGRADGQGSGENRCYVAGGQNDAGDKHGAGILQTHQATSTADHDRHSPFPSPSLAPHASTQPAISPRSPLSPPLPHHQPNKKVLVLTGPTAVGKTATSIALAKALNGEIISADSVQVYRGLDIGTAKVTQDEMDGIVHHCIDILDPQDEFSAGMFHTLATRLIEDICDRGKVPIVVGGTGFYLRWLVSGRPNTPESTSESEARVRAVLQDLWEDGMDDTARWDAGVALVRRLGDDETADRLDVQERNNWYRLERVVDILLQRPGKTMKDLDRDERMIGQDGIDYRCFFLVRERVALYRRIDYRVELMMGQGLLTETYEKLKDYIGVTDPSDQSCASRSIGYRHIIDSFSVWMARAADGGGEYQEQLSEPMKWVTEEDILQLTKSIQAATRQYSHKQMQWFRKEPAFRWLLVTDGAVREDGGEDEAGNGSVDATDGTSTITTTSTGTTEDTISDATETMARTIMDMFNAPAPPTEPDVLKENRMTKQEERKMRTYASEFVILKPDSDQLRRVVDEANQIVDSLICAE